MTENIKEKINVELLKGYYAKDEIAEFVFDHLANRERNHRITSPERLMAILKNDGGFPVTKADVIRFFRKLEEAGCGKYVEGRRGHSSRFVWYVRMSDVGQAAQGSKDTVEEIPEAELAEAVEEEGVRENDESYEEVEDDALMHEFVLRPDFSLRLKLPVNLKSSEAARISDWVRTLPFE